ncbi:MAG: galactokinase [Actinobacteria bacterium]|nr:galactokinase [Actinomycetota bacterium]
MTKQGRKAHCYGPSRPPRPKPNLPEQSRVAFAPGRANSDALPSMPTPQSRVAFAPGRVNLIGEHTDYTGGLAMPIAIQLGTTAAFEPELSSSRLELSSDQQATTGYLDLQFIAKSTTDLPAIRPGWIRYAAGVARQLWVQKRLEPVGGRIRISSTLPQGAGLSSSAALELSIGIALGFEGEPVELALACQRAEQLATGVPCGVMDQLASATGVAGCALMMDCARLSIDPVPIPDGIEIAVIHSGQTRKLSSSAYALRRAECEQAQNVIGPLSRPGITESDLSDLTDPVLKRRARHVVTENRRVAELAQALKSGDLALAGRIMLASHKSLAQDFEVSTPVLDAMVEKAMAIPGTLGARLTGAGFGGCIVVIAMSGSLDNSSFPGKFFAVQPSQGARLLS